MEKHSITIDSNKYKNTDDLWKDSATINTDAFWKDVATITKILLFNDNEVLIRYDDVGIYVIEYAYDPRMVDFGSERFMLVTEEEEDSILSQRLNNDEEDT